MKAHVPYLLCVAIFSTPSLAEPNQSPPPSNTTTRPDGSKVETFGPGRKGHRDFRAYRLSRPHHHTIRHAEVRVRQSGHRNCGRKQVGRLRKGSCISAHTESMRPTARTRYRWMAPLSQIGWEPCKSAIIQSPGMNLRWRVVLPPRAARSCRYGIA